jgi:hypothetical protein
MEEFQDVCFRLARPKRRQETLMLGSLSRRYLGWALPFRKQMTIWSSAAMTTIGSVMVSTRAYSTTWSSKIVPSKGLTLTERPFSKVSAGMRIAREVTVKKSSERRGAVRPGVPYTNVRVIERPLTWIDYNQCRARNRVSVIGLALRASRAWHYELISFTRIHEIHYTLYIYDVIRSRSRWDVTCNPQAPVDTRLLKDYD